MHQPEVAFFNDKLIRKNPHFCPTCKLWRDDSSFLSSEHYSAWQNFGMCQFCMQHFLCFDNGLLIDDRRKQKLVKVLKKNKELKSAMNVHLRVVLFPEQLQQCKKQKDIHKDKNAGKGFKDQTPYRVCTKCYYRFFLNQQTMQIGKCPKCDNPFQIPTFDWAGISQTLQNVEEK